MREQGRYWQQPEAASHTGTEYLTPRERESLILSAKGLTEDEIGSKLGIGGKAVETYKRKFFEKLDARNQTQAVLRALDHGIVRYDEVVDATFELARFSFLSPRERELVELLAQDGMSNRDLARAMIVEVKTVDTHIAAIYRKLGLKRTGVAVHYRVWKERYEDPANSVNLTKHSR